MHEEKASLWLVGLTDQGKVILPLKHLVSTQQNTSIMLILIIFWNNILDILVINMNSDVCNHATRKLENPLLTALRWKTAGD